MGVEASYYNVQYISSKEEGFSETFFRTKISQYTVYYILLYPSWIDKFIATKKGRIKPTFSLFLRFVISIAAGTKSFRIYPVFFQFEYCPDIFYWYKKVIETNGEEL